METEVDEGSGVVGEGGRDGVGQVAEEHCKTRSEVVTQPGIWVGGWRE